MRSKRRNTAACVALLIAALAAFSAFLMSPAGRSTWLSAYGVLVWLNVDHAFPASADVPLADVADGQVLVPNSYARHREVAKLKWICARFTDVDFRWQVTDNGGPSVRVKVRTWHPSDSTELLSAIRDGYEGKGLPDRASKDLEEYLASPDLWLPDEVDER